MDCLETRSDSEVIFKPRMSLSRTPPGDERSVKRGKYDEKSPEEQGGKRKGSAKSVGDKYEGETGEGVGEEITEEKEVQEVREALIQQEGRSGDKQARQNEEQRTGKQTEYKKKGEGWELAIEVVKVSVNKIHKSICREVGGRLSFRKEDQYNIREATGRIQAAFTTIIEKIGKVEKELETLKAENKYLKEINRKKREMEKTPNTESGNLNQMTRVCEEMCRRVEARLDKKMEAFMREMKEIRIKLRKETAKEETPEQTDMGTRDEYSSVEERQDTGDSGSEGEFQEVKRKKYKKKKETEAKSYAEKAAKGTKKSAMVWKTPEHKKRVESMIKMKDCGEAGKVIEALKKNLKASEIGGAPKFINQLRSGGVIINWRDEEQRKKAEEKITTIEGMEVRGLRNTDPMLMITGVSESFSAEEVIEGIVAQNEELRTSMTQKEVEEVKVITKIRCRNPWKVNWVLQAKADTFKKIIKLGRVNFDMEKLHIEEYMGLAMCFRCCRFGHIAKYCKDEPACGRCGGAHETIICDGVKKECVNCKRMNKEKIDHEARDRRCPVFGMKVEQYKKHIDYGQV